MFRRIIQHIEDKGWDIIEIGTIFIIVCWGLLFRAAVDYPILNAYFPPVLLASLMMFFGSLMLMKMAFTTKKFQHFKNLFLLLFLGFGASISSLFFASVYCKKAALSNIWWCLK
jgi:hypothetical protein